VFGPTEETAPMTLRHTTRPVAPLPEPDRRLLLHDLRTALTVISGNAQLLERWVRDGRSLPAEATLALLERILGSAQDIGDRLQRLDEHGT
jgi:signal transduction histidine kinase